MHSHLQRSLRDLRLSRIRVTGDMEAAVKPFRTPHSMPYMHFKSATRRFRPGLVVKRASETGASAEEVEELRRAVEHLKTLNVALQAEIALVVRNLSSTLNSLQQTEQQRQQHGSSAAVGRDALDEPAATGSPTYHPPAEVAQAHLACAVPHPGTLCCTKSSVTEADGLFVAALTTTARVMHGDFLPADLAAIGSRALECAAVDLCRVRGAAAQALVQPSARTTCHAFLCSILADGLVVAAEPNPVSSHFGHSSFVVELQHPATGQHLRALFKPAVEGNSAGWHRAAIEVVAYKLSFQLGLDYVPPCVYRTTSVRIKIQVDGEDQEVEFKEGAMMLYVADAQALQMTPSEAFLSDTRILDVLIQNSDRHKGGFLAGRHWCGCAPTSMAIAAQDHDLCCVLIDHAAGFRKEAYVAMEHENAFCTGPVRKVRASTYLRLRLLDRHTCHEQFGKFLTEQELRDILHRRNYVLRYLDDLVARQGYDVTVME